MQEHPSHYKNSKNTANAKPSDIIYDDQVRLSSFYPKSELEIESVDIVDRCSLHTLEPVLCSRRGPHRERPKHCN